MNEAMAPEIDGVYRYYDQMLKKQQKRLIKLDARGAPEEQRNDARQSIRKYEIVLAALESQKKAATEAWAVFLVGVMDIYSIRSTEEVSWSTLCNQNEIDGFKKVGFSCRPISITEQRKP